MKSTFACVAVFLLFISFGAQAADITVHYCKGLTADQFRNAATAAFGERKYTVEQAGPSSVTGSEDTRKAEILTTTPGNVVIRWVPGFEGKEKHLYKVAEAMLWALATESKPGEVTINWCKDLKTEQFHRAALEALHKRRYVIEQDSPSSLIGAQKKYKVEITMQAPGEIAIRWVPGFGHKKNNWLDNLTRDITWSLAL